MATDECDCMNVCMYVIKYENKQKEWHHATGLPPGGVKTARISCRFFLPNNWPKQGRGRGESRFDLAY